MSDATWDPTFHHLEAGLRFTLQEDTPDEFVAIPVKWREGEHYMLVLRRHEMEIVEQWGNGKPSTYAKRTRHFKLHTPYWVRFHLEPDRLMPAHPHITVYTWKDGKPEPRSTTFPYPGKQRVLDHREE